MPESNSKLRAAVEDFLDDIRKIRASGGGTAETSYYLPLGNLLNAVGGLLKPRVYCVSQLAQQGADHPDFGLFAAKQVSKGQPKQGLLPEGGVVEVKPASDDAWVTADSAQVSYQPIEEAPAEPWSLAGLHGQSEVAIRPYERKMSLDIAQGQISQDPEFGTSGGIQVALSDVLGNDQYHFVLSHLADSRSGFFDGLNMAFTRLHLGQRINVYWGAFRLNDRFSSRFGRFVREERLGAHIGLSYPFSRHDRIDTRLSLRHAEIDRQFEGRRLSGWLANNYVSYTHDSSLWIPTGPLEGRRYSFGLAQTIDFKTSRRFNITLFGDYRHYFRLSQRSAVAVRLMGRRSTGAVPEFTSLGGSWTLRGYRWRSLWGSKMVLYNQELRFPLVDRFLLHFPFGHMEFSAFRGALFFDAGNAWNDDFDQWRAAFGAGVRLALGGVFVFRVDAARRTDFKSIDGDTRWDFFFGWDY